MQYLLRRKRLIFLGTSAQTPPGLDRGGTPTRVHTTYKEKGWGPYANVRPPTPNNEKEASPALTYAVANRRSYIASKNKNVQTKNTANKHRMTSSPNLKNAQVETDMLRTEHQFSATEMGNVIGPSPQG